MSNYKTIPNDLDVDAFLAGVADEKRRADSHSMLEFMKRVTGEDPVMWGDSIVGFGSYHYKYASGREGDWPAAGFSPRKQALTLYIMSGFSRHDELMAKLGKFTTGKSCLYIKNLEDVDLDVLEQLVRGSMDMVTAQTDAS